VAIDPDGESRLNSSGVHGTVRAQALYSTKVVQLLSMPTDFIPRDQELMQQAMAEARAAEAAGEVPVGAIIVSSTGETIARGSNRVLRDSDPTAHAEVVALRSAGAALGNYRLSGCTLYCTLEPCSMCAGAILHARIARLVYAAADPKAGACGSVIAVMNHPALNHRVELVEGVLADECGQMLTDFFRAKRT
jgi:tRNA(adenine34) deaminase